MDKFPKTREEWESIIETSVTGGSLVANIFTLGVAGFLTGTFYRKRHEKVLADLKKMSAETIKTLEGKISMDYLKSDDFLVFISNAMTEMVRMKNIEKLKNFRSAILSGIVRTDLEEGKKHLFIDGLSNLSNYNIELLGVIHSMFNVDKYDLRTSFKHIQVRSGNKDSGYLMANLKALNRYNFVELQNTPDVVEPEYANFPVIYTRLGKEFISFITKYSGPSEQQVT